MSPAALPKRNSMIVTLNKHFRITEIFTPQSRMFMDIQLTFVVWFGFVSRHVVVHKFGMHSNQPNWCLLCSFKLKRANFLQHVRFRMPFLGWGWWFDVGRSSVQFCFIFEPFSLKCVFRVTAFAGLVYFWTIPGTQRPIFESFELFAKA